MAIDLLLVRQGSRLVAHDPIALESIETLKHGETVSATLKRTRNAAHHRKFFALLKAVFEAQTRYAAMEKLLNGVKIATGHYEMETLPGKIPVQICVPCSISFARMDQTAFESFYDKAVDYLITEVIPGTGKADLESHVLSIIGEQHGYIA